MVNDKSINKFKMILNCVACNDLSKDHDVF